MTGLPLNVISDICDQVGAWKESFLSETSLDRYRRAAAWAMSETAKAAKIGALDALDVAFDNPTPWMRKAFTYRRALTRTGDIIEADVSVLPSQSVVMKYAMGDGPQTRRPGDVGLAKDRILVPHWRNLALTQGINRNAYGNLPGGVAARLAREAGGTRAKTKRSGRWGVYKGELDVGGSRVAGYIARPFRGEAPIGKNGRSNGVFGRRSAPVGRLIGRLAKGEAAFVFNGTVPNLKGQPLVDEWPVVVFRDGEFKQVQPIREFIARTSLGGGDVPNVGTTQVDDLQPLVAEAVQRAQTFIHQARKRFQGKMDTEVLHLAERHDT